MQKTKGMVKTMKHLFGVALLFILMTGCVPNSTFVYKPSGLATDVSKLPVKIAVLPFADETENFTTRGNMLFSPEYNLAKGGLPGQITALTPEMWAKSFADEMASSGEFHTVRFIYNRAEITDEDYFVAGTLEKAYNVFTVYEHKYQFALALSAHRKTDGLQVWQKKVDRLWRETPDVIFKECWSGFAFQCMADSHHAFVNQAMREILAEARADLLRTLAPLSGGRDGTNTPKPAAMPAPPPESLDATIESILKTQ
jgi:hypothetical protein